MQKLIFERLLRQLCSRRGYSYKTVRRPDVTIERKATATFLKQSQEKDQTNAQNLTKQLRAKILASGPITVADYMREVLISPLAGYYMNRDVFGREGDFITSPEISQIFGELIAVWLILEWQKLGSPVPFQLVELGPGRGTLIRDILRVITQFKLTEDFSIHLVEISPFLSGLQAQRFCITHQEVNDPSLPYYQMGKTGSGINVYWYKHLEQLPPKFSIVLAHEFFDALPVHKLQLDGNQWKEILIDVNETANNETDFRFVISNNKTPLSQLYKPLPGDLRQCLEYSVEAERIMGILAERIEMFGGFNLIMDYGHFGDKTDTFRAFKNHQLHEPLKDPGTADLTADVDFRQLKIAAEQKANVLCYGPVEQGYFMKKMEGDTRLEQLLKNAHIEQHERIKSGYEMLTDAKQMGKRFKFFSVFPGVLKEYLEKYPVNGFS